MSANRRRTHDRHSNRSPRRQQVEGGSCCFRRSNLFHKPVNPRIDLLSQFELTQWRFVKEYGHGEKEEWPSMDKIGRENESPAAGDPTSPLVKCDVCGLQFNRRHLASHKRLSHGKSNKSALETVDEAKVVETILTLYRLLPASSKNDLLKRLAALSQTD